MTRGLTVPELETRLTKKGQVTIPAGIRRRLGLKPGDRVRFEVDGEEVRIRPATSKLLEGYGAVTPRKRPEDWRKLRAEVEQAIGEEAAGADQPS